MRLSNSVRPAILALALCASAPLAFAASDRGKEYLRTGQVEKAKTYYDEWLAKDPASPDAQAGSGAVLIAYGDFDAAMTRLESGLETNPEHYDLNLNLSLAYYYKAKELADLGRSAVSVGSLFNDAVRKAEVAAKIDPQRFEAFQTLGVIQQFQSEFESSVASLRKATELAPEDSYTWYQLGESLRFSEDYEEAVKAYDKAAKTFKDAPGFYEAVRLRGLCYQWLEDEDAAAKAYVEAISISPDSAAAWDDLWNLYAAQKKFDEAEVVYLDLLKKQPRNAYVHLVLGSVYAYNVDFDEALAAFKKAIDLAKTTEIKAAAYYQVGITYKELDETEKAVEALQMALKVSPEFEDPIAVLSGIAREKSEAGEFAAAAKVNEFLAEFKQTDGFIWSDLGLVYRDWGKYKEALAAYEKAAKFEPYDAQILNDYAVVLDYHFDRVEEAFPLYVQALEIENNIDAMQNLTRIYLKRGKFKDAVEMATKALEYDSSRPVIRDMLEEAKRRMGQTSTSGK